jgi:glycosyltransferase involved in cell wall biosynthesis
MLEDGALAHRALRKRLAWTLIERATVEGATALHATSAHEHDTLVRMRPSAEVVLVPNGVDIPELPPHASRRPVIAFIGRIHPIKRLDLLVDAFVRLHAQRGDATLVIAGPDEAGLRGALTARAGSAAAAITWPGAVDVAAKTALLAEAAAVVVCSDSESFGLSAAEAMAAAVPVVVTRTCPWAEVERHGAGYWVEQSADAIAGAVQALLADPTAARAMGARGRALIEQKYRWDVVARDLIQYYERITRCSQERALLGSSVRGFVGS